MTTSQMHRGQNGILEDEAEGEGKVKREIKSERGSRGKSERKRMKRKGRRLKADDEKLP